MSHKTLVIKYALGGLKTFGEVFQFIASRSCERLHTIENQEVSIFLLFQLTGYLCFVRGKYFERALLYFQVDFVCQQILPVSTETEFFIFLCLGCTVGVLQEEGEDTFFQGSLFGSLEIVKYLAVAIFGGTRCQGSRVHWKL